MLEMVFRAVRRLKKIWNCTFSGGVVVLVVVTIIINYYYYHY